MRYLAFFLHCTVYTCVHVRGIMQQLVWLQLGLKYLSIRVWTAEIGEELVCHREHRNAHNFNPTKCTTISKYGMNVDDEAKVYHILAQDDILVPDVYHQI